MNENFVNTYLDDKYFYGKEKNNDLIKQMQNYYQYYKNNIEKEKNDNIELINLYENFINEVATLLKKLNTYNNPFLYPFLLSNLIALGITSEYNENFNASNSFDLINFLGINVIMGQGVCRNVNSFANDIFNKLELKSNTLFISLESNSMKPNHLITLINLNDKYYGFDVYNNLLFVFKKYNQLKCVNDFTLKDSQVPIFQYYAYFGLKENQFNELLMKLQTHNNIDYNYLKHLQLIANDIISPDNKDIFEFYNKTKNIKNKIKNIFELKIKKKH